MNDLLSFVTETARAAGAELLARQGSRLKVSYKPDRSLVTEADLAAEAIILARIRERFPNDKIFSEEAGLSSNDRSVGSSIWIIDPLDGTTNYANGYPFYCVSIARGSFTDTGTIAVECGCIFDPAYDRCFSALRGHGAHHNGNPISVSKPRPLEQCFLVTGFYYSQGNELDRAMARFHRITQRCQAIRRDGAAALDLALSAAGTFDAFWEEGLQPWDVAAGSLIVTEAGGKVVNYGQNPSESYDIEGQGIIAGAGATVDELSTLL